MKLEYLTSGVSNGAGLVHESIVVISGIGLCEATVRHGRPVSTIHRSLSDTVRRLEQLGVVDDIIKKTDS